MGKAIIPWCAPLSTPPLPFCCIPWPADLSCMQTGRHKRPALALWEKDRWDLLQASLCIVQGTDLVSEAGRRLCLQPPLPCHTFPFFSSKDHLSCSPVSLSRGVSAASTSLNQFGLTSRFSLPIILPWDLLPLHISEQAAQMWCSVESQRL